MKVVIATLFLSFALTVSGQGSAKPVSADTFGRIPCDELNAHAAALAQLIDKTPGSRAFVVAGPKTRGIPIVKHQFREILANFQFVNLDDKVSFIIGKELPDFRYEMWLIPSGAAPPTLEGEPWTPPAYDVTKSFIFVSVDENGECPTFVPRKFAELLKSVPGSRANVVIRHGDRYSMSARDLAKETVNDLVNAHVPRGHIRIFYAKGGSSLTYAEIWFVASKR